jgi:hypothetical protein
MAEMKNSFLLCSVLLIFACDRDPRGIAHKSIEDTYQNLSFGKTVYSESLLRAVSRVSEIDSNYFISSNTEYVLDWSIDTAARWYIENSDSLVKHDLHKAGMEEYASYRSADATYSLYVLTGDEDIIYDLVIMQLDTAELHIYEFVGEMPVENLMKFGLGNYEEFNRVLNFNLLPNAASDSTDQ